tara:strand:- start:7487 stop:8065 length:579 start_codon:yes stop_codon:yes gene_type:complete
MTLGEKLSLIQQEFKAKKSRFNAFGKYNFRSAEDILEGLKPFNAKYKVYFLVNEDIDVTSGVPVVTSTASIHDVESDLVILTKAIVGVDTNQKGMQLPQAFGSASSYGKKYALGNLLLIDDTADADATNGQGKATASAPQGSPAKKDDSFQQSIDYLKSTPDDKKGMALKMIIEKYGNKFSAPQLAALKKFV